MPWFVIYTKSRNEKKVAEGLQRMGLEVYCPLVTMIKKWSDRKKKVQVPLLSSYVFVCVEEKDREKVFQVTGVVRYLFWLGKPAIVRDDEIAALKEGLKETLVSFEVQGIKVGDVVPVPSGPFQGKEGKINKINKNSLQLILTEVGVLITLVREER
jgi:transcriptional antiterminator RfaH